jgi:S-adenosylmethionine hydrolase
VAIITLTTDFGTRDGYVGAMKGVILGVAPTASVVDISHEISPQDVAEGAFVLASACPCFPPATIHVAVVDPGVGTERRGVLIETERYVLIGPDNGLFSGVLAVDPLVRAVSLENPSLMRPDVSATFHGRDVFAPAAAHIARGVPVAEFGPEVASPVELNLWRAESTSGCVTGRVVHIDGFGNCVTNIGRAAVE